MVPHAWLSGLVYPLSLTVLQNIQEVRIDSLGKGQNHEAHCKQKFYKYLKNKSINILFYFTYYNKNQKITRKVQGPFLFRRSNYI